MSYYMLPKNYNIINVNPSFTLNKCSPYLSQSLLNCYYQTKNQIIEIFSSDPKFENNSFDDAIKIINQYEFIFSKVTGFQMSVSKLKHKTNIFYDLLEIFNNLNIFEHFKHINNLKILHISPNYIDSVDCLKIFREEQIEDEHIFYKNINDAYNDLNKFNFIFFETDNETYLTSVIESLLIILKNQADNGTAIIKISNVFYKPVVDALYLLSSLYDKVYMCKPNTNNISSFDRYIVCSNLKINKQPQPHLHLHLKFNYLKLLVFIKKLDNKNILEILDFKIPYYFKNKIDDLNIILGQQQIDSLDYIVNLYKNKNKSNDDKIENIKKKNIEKSVSWCEKYKIPFNKFTENNNIFLPIDYKMIN